MNERIFELAKQAQIKFEAHLQHLGIDTAVITPADLEKFAELLIEECILIARKAENEDEVYAWFAISNHFGDEE